MRLVYDWDTEKNELLIRTRGVSFEEVLAVLESGDVLDVIDHPNQEQYSHQKISVLHTSSKCQPNNSKSQTKKSDPVSQVGFFY